MDLFSHNLAKKIHLEAPLAERMRPTVLDDFIGQESIIGSDSLLRKAIEEDVIPSLILWGPPGVGKSTLARIIAVMTRSVFVELSAVASGVKELRIVLDAAQRRRAEHNQRTILFIDEIHRWNKAQQDALLPHVERGLVTLIGATTENPSFEVVSALLSRCRVVVLEQLTVEHIETILKRAVAIGFASTPTVAPAAVRLAARLAGGDARAALNTLEFAVTQAGAGTVITEELITKAAQRAVAYDKSGEQHYNCISALHKSIRGGDASAALYWLGRMLEGGEDPLFIARRLIRLASEDIGLADTHALVQAVACYQACHNIGMPECDVILAQCVAYLARAPKSVAVYRAYAAARQDATATAGEPVPLHLRNAPTKLMQDLSYGKGYKYSPEYQWQEQQEYFPDILCGRDYFSDSK